MVVDKLIELHEDGSVAPLRGGIQLLSLSAKVLETLDERAHTCAATHEELTSLTTYSGALVVHHLVGDANGLACSRSAEN